jgi:putative FmdB family regulatory protein
MPLYEYVCKGCDGEFEVLVRSVASNPHPTCPDCGSGEVRKLLSLIAARGSRGEEATVSAPASQPRFGGGCCGGGCGCGH